MKILFINGTDFENRKLTGAHKRFIELVKSFSERNEVSLIAYPYSGFEGYNIAYYPIINVVGKSLPNHLSELMTLRRALVDNKSKIEYDYAIAFGTTAAICYKWAGYHNVITLFREDLIGYQKAVGASYLKLLYFWLQERIAVKNSEKIIVQCKHDKNALVGRHKGIEEKLFVQGNNINVSWAKNFQRNQEKTDRIVKMLFIGNFTSIRKGHQILLPAVARLLEEGICFDLYVLGEGKALNECKEKYKKYPRIHFVGHTNKVNDYLAMCDIDIVPSLIDSCPNTILEGITAGLAVYGTRAGGIPDLLREDKYMFEPDSESIYEFLKEKMGNKTYITDQIDQQILRGRLTFDWGKAIEDLIVGNNDFC